VELNGILTLCFQFADSGSEAVLARLSLADRCMLGSFSRENAFNVSRLEGFNSLPFINFTLVRAYMLKRNMTP
jgi:hypothetical protein